MKGLFNSKYSDRPTWLCVVLAILVLSASVLVATDLAGVLDFVFQSKPVEVDELRLPDDVKIINDTVTDAALNLVEIRGKRGMFSYYLEAYPYVLGIATMNKAEEVAKYMIDIQGQRSNLGTQEEKDAYDVSNKDKITQYGDSMKIYAEDLSHKVSLVTVAVFVYRLLSIVLAFWIFKIPTGLDTKIAYWLLTRKTRWLF